LSGWHYYLKSERLKQMIIMKASAKFLSGFLIGTTVGLATGLLIAPVSGNQTRRNIVRKSRVYSQQAIDAVRQYLKQSRNKGLDIHDPSEEWLNDLERGVRT
jgi:gas vesicle protein